MVRRILFVFTAICFAATIYADFTDADAQEGQCYYYIRLFQRCPEKPDGDPEIAWASPIFAKYAG